MTERSVFYKQLSKVMEFKSTEEEICQKLKSTFLSELYTRETPMIDLLNEYFETRKAIGRNENVILATLEMIAAYHCIQGDHFFHLRDLFGADLFGSAKFDELVEDLSIFLRPNMEFDAHVFAQIVDCLRIMGFKNRKLMLGILDRALVDLKAKADLGSASVQFSNAFSDDIKRIMQIDSTFSMSAEQKMEVIEAAAALEPDADSEVLSAEKCLEVLRGASLASEQLIFEFRAGVTSLRDNYFALKQPQKVQLLRRNPELLLDFLSIEEQMIQIGLLMPVDLLSLENKSGTNEIALNQSALEAGVDSRLERGVRPLPDASAETAEIFEAKSRKREIGSAIVLAKIIGWIRSPTPSVDPDDDITDTRFGYLFGRDKRAFEAVMDEASPNTLRKLHEQGSVVSEKGAQVPMYVYSYTFKDFVDSLRQSASALSFDGFSYDTNLLLSGAFSFAGLEEPRIKAALATGTPQPLNPSADQVGARAELLFVEGLSGVLEFVPWRGFSDWLAALDRADLFARVSDRLLSPAGHRHVKADLLFFAEAARRAAGDAPTAQLAAAGGEVFESLLDSHRRSLLPDDGSLLKAWTFLAAAEAGEARLPGAASRSLSAIEGLLVQDHTLSARRDRPFLSVAASVRAQFGDSALLRLRLSEFLPPQLAPAAVAGGAGGTRSLHVLPFGVTADSVLFALLTTRVAEAGQRLGVGHVEAVAAPIAAFFEDKSFNQTFNFALDTRPENFAALFGPLAAGAYAFRGLEPAVRDIAALASPGQAKLLAASLRALEAWAARLAAGSATPATATGLRLAAAALEDALRENPELQGSVAEVRRFVEEALRPEASGAPVRPPGGGPSALPFVGRRYGFEGFEAPAKPASLAFGEFCNRTLLNSPEYMLFDSWAAALGDRFSALDFGRCGDRLVADNCAVERVLLPSPDGRSQVKVPDFGLFWEGTTSDRSGPGPEQLLRFERQGHFESRVGPVAFNVALLNALYSFRTLPSFGEFFERFFGLEFWPRLIDAVLRPKNAEKPTKISTPFDPKDVNRVLSARPDSSPYARGFEKYKALMKEVEYWKNMCEVILPQRFQNSNKEEEKLEISKEHNQAQKNYLESLKQYKEVFSDHSTMYNNEDFHDLVTRVEYKDAALETEEFEDTPHFATRDELVRSSVADLLYAYLVSKSISKVPLTPDEQRLFDAFETKNGELRNLPLGVETNICVPISEIFGEKDFDFFANELVFADFKKFGSHDFADLAVALGLMINRDLLDFHRISTHLKKLSGEKSEDLDDIILDFARYVPNRLFFNFHQLEAVSSHVSKRLNETDTVYLKKLFGIGKGQLSRREASSQKVERQRRAEPRALHPPGEQAVLEPDRRRQEMLAHQGSSERTRRPSAANPSGSPRSSATTTSLRQSPREWPTKEEKSSPWKTSASPTRNSRLSNSTASPKPC